MSDDLFVPPPVRAKHPEDRTAEHFHADVPGVHGHVIKEDWSVAWKNALGTHIDRHHGGGTRDEAPPEHRPCGCPTRLPCRGHGGTSPISAGPGPVIP